MTRKLICACCGGDAGRWQQWFNRDTGYGLCRKCADRIETRETPAEFESCYGRPGVNYAPKVQP